MKTEKHMSLVERLIADYERTGTLPFVSGGDHDDASGDTSGQQDSDATSSGKSGKESESSSTSGDDKKSGGFKPITTQEDLDSIIINRLRRQEKNLRSEITQEIQASLKQEADKKAAEEQGDFKKLYEAEVEKAGKLQEEIDKLKAEVKQQEQDDLRKQIAAEFKLPEDVADRLRGDTEAELKADAKKLAEVVTPREAPDIDTGKSSGENKRRKKEEEKDRTKASYWGLPS